MNIALLWQTENPGLYSNSDFKKLYDGVGHNNGNLAFVYAIKNALKGNLRFFPWHARPEILASSCDVVVIPCANQLGHHTELGEMAQRLRRIGKPIVAIGLGAQAKKIGDDIQLSDGTLDWVRAIDENRFGPSSNIYTRGPFTSQQLDRIGIHETVVGGCPSHFINPDPDLGKKIEARWKSTDLPRSIAVAAGHQSWVEHIDIEHQLIAMMMDDAAPGKYIVQSMGDMIKISRGLFDEIDETALSKIHRYTVPHFSREEFISWCNRYAHSYYDVPAWMDSLRRHDLTIGTRYHGIALALQAGRMGVTVTIDSRTEELCSQTGVPYLRGSSLKMPLTRRTLKENLIQFDGSSYDALRKERARNFVGFLRNNGLEPADPLAALAA